MNISARVEAYLAPFDELARVRPRPPGDPEILALAGKSRHGIYREIASRALRCERADAPPRKDGRKGASHIFVTLRDVAEWRASRSSDDGSPILKEGSR